MYTVLRHIEDNIISQINAPKYGPNNNVACEFSIPAFLISQNKKIVVCLPDNFSAKLCNEYMKNRYPMIRIGYMDEKIISYNLSTQIIYINSEVLKEKTLKFFQDNSKCQNFADIIIMVNPDMDKDDNIFIISSFKYANDNNILLPKLSILNSQYSYKLTENIISFQHEREYPKISFIDQINFTSIVKDVVKIVKFNYYQYISDVLIYVSSMDMAKSINIKLIKMIPDCNVLLINNNYNETIHTFRDLLNVKSKKIIICINFGEFHFENVGLVIDLVQSYTKQNYPKVLGYHLPNEYFSLKNIKQKTVESEDNSRSMSDLIIDYVNCDIAINKLSLDTISKKFRNINLNKTINLMKNLNLLMVHDDKLLVSASGFFSKRLKLAPRKSSFIWEWILKEYPIYQGIIIVSLIDELCLSMLNKNFHAKWFGKSPMQTYLNMFNCFILDHKNNIDTIIKNYDSDDISICKKWADNNKISSEKFLSLISNINQLYNIITKEMRNINTVITNFNVQNVMDLALPIFKEIYLETVLIVKNNNIIQPHENIQYSLNKYNIRNILKDDKIIPLLLRKMINNDGKKTEIISIDNFIVF